MANKKLKIFRITSDAVIPTRSYSGDLGYDLYASEKVVIKHENQNTVCTGISVEIPEGWGGFIKDRSSVAVKRLYTSAGVVDNGYRGEIKIVIRNESGVDVTINKGDKIAQFVPIPITDWDIVEKDKKELSLSDREEKGFGSSGK